MTNHSSHAENLQIAVASAIAILAIGLVLGTVLIHEIKTAAAQTNLPLLALAAPPVTSSTISLGLPLKLLIPNLNLQADVEQVTLTTNGSMDVPKDPMNAGWYALGPVPGTLGSAVMDGHVNWWGGKTGIFKNLHLLQPGAEIMVVDDAGVVVTFIVTKIQKYDAAADATDIFTSTDGLAHLNLITCTGAWNTTKQQYNDRLVIFTNLIANK